MTQKGKSKAMVTELPGELKLTPVSRLEAVASVTLLPAFSGAETINRYSSSSLGPLDLNSLVSELAAQSRAVNKGDLERAESMLITQAHTLDAIFNNLAQRATQAEYLSSLDQLLRLALKAQSQCRATLETLAAIKNPSPVAFVRQANITTGPQQVNNGVAAEAPRVEKNINPPNELLEVKPNEWLDTRTPGAAVGTDSALETVGEIDRTKNLRGEKAGGKERRPRWDA